MKKIKISATVPVKGVTVADIFIFDALIILFLLKVYQLQLLTDYPGHVE